jgi:hypothetical protein
LNLYTRDGLARKILAIQVEALNQAVSFTPMRWIVLSTKKNQKSIREKRDF